MSTPTIFTQYHGGVLISSSEPTSHLPKPLTSFTPAPEVQSDSIVVVDASQSGTPSLMQPPAGAEDTTTTGDDGAAVVDPANHAAVDVDKSAGATGDDGASTGSESNSAPASADTSAAAKVAEPTATTDKPAATTPAAAEAVKTTTKK